MIVLNLTLHKEPFDKIVAGEKKIEYREIKQYWTTRLLSKKYDAVKFKNGYNKNAPTVLVSLLKIKTNTKNGVYELHLGPIIK